MTKRLCVGFALLAAGFSFAVGSAEGMPGVLDSGFGDYGTVRTPFASDSSAAAVLVQSDGKIVAVGTNSSDSQFLLARYQPNGSLDPTFGNGGTVTAPDGQTAAAVLQPDGKIVVGGTTSMGPSAFVLARFNPDGSPDTSFGNGGVVQKPIGTSADSLRSLLLQPDGKIVAAGNVTDSSSQQAWALARFNSDGSLDTTFGNGGVTTTAIGPDGTMVFALALQPDGKIVAGGEAGYCCPSLTDWALARYEPDGSLDPSFGNAGIVTTPPIDANPSDLNALALEPDGKIVAAGNGSTGSEGLWVVTRYNADGSLDTSFGSGGTAANPLSGTSGIADTFDVPRAAAVQPDGKIVLAGGSQQSGSGLITVARYNTDGSLDPTFGNGGVVMTRPSAWNDAYADALALQPDGKIVVAGEAEMGFILGQPSEQFAVARFLGSTLTVSRTGTGNGTVASTPAGISCGTTCAAPFAALPVTLTATPDAGSVFAGWSGGGCSGTGMCQVQMSGDQTVTATFALAETLTVQNVGTGSGTISSRPTGILCGSVCTYAFAQNSTVTLTAKPSPGSTFEGWAGDCYGKGRCSLDMFTTGSAIAIFSVCVVPRLKDRSLHGAKLAISRADCSLRRVKRVFSRQVRRGRVISQRPRPGKKLAAGSPVEVTVSKGWR